MRRAPEQAFQISVVQYLMRALPDGFLFTAFPAGGGGRVRGARLKAMGLKAGFPDLVVFKPPYAAAQDVTGAIYNVPHKPQHELYWIEHPLLWLELKSKSGSLSTEQKTMHAALRTLGHMVETIKTLEHMESALIDFCFPTALKARLR